MIKHEKNAPRRRKIKEKSDAVQRPKRKVLVFWPHSMFWTKSLMCKDAVNMDSTCQSIFRRLCTGKKIVDFRFPVSRPGDVSSRLDNVSSRPDDVSSRPNIHLSTVPSVRTLHCIEKLLFQLASVRPSQQPVWTSINDRSASDSFQVQNMGRLIHRPDDVVSRPDALVNKARIALQISPSGRQSALVRTRAHRLRKLPIRLQPSGRLSLVVRTHA
jgi:hypothetical protein